MKRAWLLVALLLTACAPDETTGNYSKCSTDWGMNAGSCHIQVGTLAEQYSHNLTNDNFKYYESSTAIRARVTSEHGRVKFWFLDRDKQPRSVTVEAGQSAVLEGPVHITLHRKDIELHFERLAPGPSVARAHADVQFRAGPHHAPWRPDPQ